MRHLSLALVLVLAAGCAEEKKPDPQPARSTQPQAAPATSSPPKAATTDTTSPSDDQIVIKGSKHKSTSSSSSAASDPNRDARIAELKAKAKASEGKDAENGQPIKAPPPEQPVAQGNDAKKEKIRQAIDEKQAEINKLHDEKKAMSHTQVHREGHMKATETTYDDPDRAKAIDQRIDDLNYEKRALEKKIVDIDAGIDDSKPAAKPGPGGAGPNGPGPGGPPR